MCRGNQRPGDAAFNLMTGVHRTFVTTERRTLIEPCLFLAVIISYAEKKPRGRNSLCDGQNLLEVWLKSIHFVNNISSKTTLSLKSTHLSAFLY